MSIKSNSLLPGYTPESFSAFIDTVTTEWNLPREYLQAAEMYFLRHWTAAQICEILTCDGIQKQGEMFLPLFSKSAMRAYNGELTNPSAEPRHFWLSFRAVRYPLGTSFKHASILGDSLKCYVLIQLDDKS